MILYVANKKNCRCGKTEVTYKMLLELNESSIEVQALDVAPCQVDTVDITGNVVENSKRTVPKMVVPMLGSPDLKGCGSVQGTRNGRRLTSQEGEAWERTLQDRGPQQLSSAWISSRRTHPRVLETGSWEPDRARISGCGRINIPSKAHVPLRPTKMQAKVKTLSCLELFVLCFFFWVCYLGHQYEVPMKASDQNNSHLSVW
ncbi:uncharacterized protein [Narcine bancroftii]|uniref:uncharacterized protein isoform X1 n=1 Tax=Narcine bancroftii TaxID=1343680 RepID=UPI00383100E6